MQLAGPTNRVWPALLASATVSDARIALELIEHQLRPPLRAAPKVDICHATANGLSVLPALGPTGPSHAPCAE